MELRIYLYKKKISITAFAQKIGYSRSQISNVINRSKPSKRLALAIEEATNGEVTLKELL